MSVTDPVVMSALLAALFFIVAFLYSSVGHGGASGYLAILSLFAFAPREMSTTALILNVVVAGISFAAYSRRGFFSSRLTIPFLIGSIPFAVLGGALSISTGVYAVLLSIALCFAALRLFLPPTPDAESSPEKRVPSYFISIPVGGAIGLLSGIVGVGGGIFLSPLILLLRWSDPKRTAATSACFIVVNSLAGILGRQFSGTIAVGDFVPLLIAAGAGGILGSWWGSAKFSNLTIRRLLAVVLVIAAGKLIINLLRQ